MADEHKAKRLEIAHVLFMDIVGYSKLLTDEQSEALQELNQIVRSTEAAREAEAAGAAYRFADRRWHGAGFYRVRGRAGRMRPGDQPCFARATESAGEDGNPQRPDPSGEGCKRSRKHRRHRHQHRAASDGLRRRRPHSRE